MGWYKATNAHFHRDYYKRRKLGGLQGTTTKSVRSILLFSKCFTVRLERSEAYEKRQSNGAHIEKIFHRASRGEITSHFFARCSMASTLQICFLRLCKPFDSSWIVLREVEYPRGKRVYIQRGSLISQRVPKIITKLGTWGPQFHGVPNILWL